MSATGPPAEGGPGLHAADDARIERSARESYSFRTYLKDDRIQVKASDGVVTLTGTADSQAQKQLTTKYAKDVDGVSEVRNNLVVANAKPAKERFTERIDDASITAQVKAALLFHKSTHAMATKVTTRDGVVTLAGEAENAAERDLAAKYAEDVAGVRKVRNEMTVRRG